MLQHEAQRKLVMTYFPIYMIQTWCWYNKNSFLVLLLPILKSVNSPVIVPYVGKSTLKYQYLKNTKFRFLVDFIQEITYRGTKVRKSTNQQFGTSFGISTFPGIGTYMYQYLKKDWFKCGYVPRLIFAHFHVTLIELDLREWLVSALHQFLFTQPINHYW